MLKFIFLSGMWVNIYSIDYIKPPNADHPYFKKRPHIECVIYIRGHVSGGSLETTENCGIVMEKTKKALLSMKKVVFID